VNWSILFFVDASQISYISCHTETNIVFKGHKPGYVYAERQMNVQVV
jgi:hypothetical protein